MRHSATLGAMIHATTTTRAATKVPTPTPTIDRRARARPSALPRASETTLAMTKISTPVIATVIATTLATTTGAALAIDMQIVDSQTRDYMKRRDEAAAFKCTGGMFDCDSDRREYARAQGFPDWYKICGSALHYCNKRYDNPDTLVPLNKFQQIGACAPSLSVAIVFNPFEMDRFRVAALLS